VTATSTTPRDAELLATTTVKAFGLWLTRHQRESNVPESQRVIVQELQAPRGVVKLGGPSYTLPFVLLLVVLVAFAGLAILLDRVFPADRDRGKAARAPEPEPETAPGPRPPAEPVAREPAY
jgi:hypothetical protein